MKLSKQKRDKIAEQILACLYHNSPTAIFTSKIAESIARDEEFTKQLLKELWQKNLVVPIKKNSNGVAFSRRIKWRLSNQAYSAYKQHQ